MYEAALCATAIRFGKIPIIQKSRNGGSRQQNQH